jgi:hypothetical protein
LTGSSSQEPIDLGLRLLGSDRISATPFQYSAVMALGASRLGVPARVVVGARPGPRGIVRQTDVFSWVELQLADGTWRPLDPERYTGVHAHAEEEEQAAAAAGASAWVAGALGLDEDREVKVKIPKGADIELSPGDVIEEPSEPLRTAGLGLAILVALALAALLAVPGAKVVRRWHRRRRRSWSAVYVNGWQEVLDVARDLGNAVPEGWSRFAQAAALGAGAELAREADAAVFAPVPASEEDGREFWRACQQLRRQLVHDADVPHRVWSYLNPTSLLAGWARNRARESSARRTVRHEDRGARRQQPAGA